MKLKLIRDLDGIPYLLRWTLFNFRGYSLKLHVFLKSDLDRGNALHDHPWKFKTFILLGGYWEHTAEGRFWRPPGYFGGGDANYFHRVELDRYPVDHEDSPGDEKLAVTLFFTYPREKEWGFNCKQGWKEANKFHREGGCGDD